MCRVQQRELERRIYHPDAVILAHRLNRVDTLDDLGRRNVVVVIGTGPYAGGQDATEAKIAERNKLVLIKSADGSSFNLAQPTYSGPPALGKV